MKIIDVVQGSKDWLDIRTKHFTASEAPAMMGASKYLTRSDLLKQKATGYIPEVDAAKQRLFDSGHAAEAAARPLIEAQIGDDLYPVTCTSEVNGIPLLASMDGLTMCETTGWECKLFNEKLEQQILNESIDAHYYWQLEHQMLVSGCEKVIFTTSDGTPEHTTSFTYTSKPERRAALIAGWKQFLSDLANYQLQVVIPAAMAAPIKELPALNIQISGSVVASNLTQWKDVVVARIVDISTDLKDDQDFATAEATVKWLDDGEKKIDLVKSQAQSQAADIDAVFRAMDEIKATMRSKRLELDKLVKARKESIRMEIMQEAQAKLTEHVTQVNKRLGFGFISIAAADFVSAIKGKKSVASLRDACDTELARAKIAVSEVADRIEINKRVMETLCDPAIHFPDFAAVCTKATDDFANLVAHRVTQHKEAEERKARERAQAEEAKRVEDERKAQAAACIANEAPAVAPQPNLAAEAMRNNPPPSPNQSSIQHDEQQVWRQAKSAIVVMLDTLTVSELEAVADYITRKSWRKAA